MSMYVYILKAGLCGVRLNAFKSVIQSGMRLLNVSISLFAVTVFEMIIWSVKTIDAWAALSQPGCLKY